MIFTFTTTALVVSGDSFYCLVSYAAVLLAASVAVVIGGVCSFFYHSKA
jgi:hypothetical protein